MKTVLDPELYPVAALADLPSPALVVFEKHVLSNLASLRTTLEALAPGSGFEHLRPHAKTHKSSWVTERLLEAGIKSFKASPHELEALLAAGARDVFVAYPLLGSAAREVARLAAQFPDARVATLVSKPRHVEILASAAKERDLRLDVLLDLDVGDHRTGVPPREAWTLARAVADEKRLRLVGLHAYDGHNHDPDPAARRACARESIDSLLECLDALRSEGHAIGELVVGGSPGYEPCLAELLERRETRPELRELRIEGSPGTWIYWDSNYEALLPGRFRYAALLYARVLDTTGDGRITLDLGHKRWGIDQGPVEVFSREGLRVVKTSEEHTVLVDEAALAGSRPPLEIDEPILFAPRHVCPTVNLWESFWLVRVDGSIERKPVDSRNR